MDEKQYKSTYTSINPQRCVYEKAINSRVCNCAKAQRFNLADREGVACSFMPGLERCTDFLELLRGKTRFVLHRIEVEQALGHAEEIKIQNGGLLGLQSQAGASGQQTVEDINSLFNLAEALYSTLDNFPYSLLMQTIATYRIRNRRKQT